MTDSHPASSLIIGGAASSPRAPLPTLPPLALYIHIPWCVRKCPYCDFNSHTASPVLPEEEYVDALLADLDQDLHAVYRRAGPDRDRPATRRRIPLLAAPGWRCAS